ncbi:MAG TPA: thiamine-phosphate kinase, partial [Gemmatimonadales bacterium]|nr:thiamine-phosphate kinase [Gemmatimonadales bacterium]
DQVLALSTDTSVESVHFRRAWASLEEIGWRAAAGALSDLAAVAAEPIGLLAALVLPPGLGEEDSVALMRGVANAGASVGAVVLGGDLSAGGELVITITVVGRCERPVRRSGARPGDGLWVTGRLGGPRAALEGWIAGGAPAAAARAAFLHPEPRVGAARWLASHGATAMIDLSDGLAGDAGHLAAASGVRLEIDLARIPLHPDLAAVTAAAGAPAAELAARGGEDYELLVAMPPDFGDAVAALATEEVGVGLTRIGAVVPGSGVRLSLDGRDVALTSYDHFA